RPRPALREPNNCNNAGNMRDYVGRIGLGFSVSKVSCTLLLVLGAGLASTQAADIAWTNINGGVWSAATNWSPNTVPGSPDNAYITNSGTYTVTLDVGATLSGLRAGGVGGGTQTLVNASQTFTLNGPGVLETNTIFNLSGGALDGTGQLLV